MATSNPIARAQSIDEYISVFPKQTQRLMQKLRLAIRKAAPKAMEVISYGMPAFSQEGMLVYFAAYKSHIGFYPTGSGINAFKNEIRGFKHSKGAVQFPLDKELPLDLVRRMVKFKLEENKLKALSKTKAKPAVSKSKSKNAAV